MAIIRLNAFKDDNVLFTFPFVVCCEVTRRSCEHQGVILQIDRHELAPYTWLELVNVGSDVIMPQSRECRATGSGDLARIDDGRAVFVSSSPLVMSQVD